MTNTIANRIPGDIIREILSHLKSPLLIHKPGKFPWYLGHICAAWRAEFLPLCNTIIIEFLEQTQIESSTGFRFEFTPLSNYERILNVLRWYLEKNADIPFSFKFCMAYLYTAAESTYVRHALVMLCEQSIRWVDASLWILREDIDVLYQVKHRVPLLKALALRAGAPVDSQTDSDIFVNAPVLSTLSLFINAPWNFPWASLTSLSFDITVYNVKTRFDALSETVNLEELFISSYPTKDLGYNKRIMLPRLTRLSVLGITPLTILSAPTLVRLFVDVPKTKSFSTVIRSFFHASGCQVQQLQTRLNSTSDFMELVACTPDLQHLHMTDNTGIFPLLQSLMPKDSRTTPLSRLQSLRLDCLIYDDELHQQLCAFVKSRSRGIKSEGEMFVERLRTLVILQQDKPGWRKHGIELEKVCDECGVRLQFFESKHWHHIWDR